MDGSRDRDAQGGGKLRPPALEDAYGELPAVRHERQPQGRGRGFLRGRQRAEQQDEGCARFRGQSEPPQLAIARARQPQEQRPAGAGTQHLLGGPQRIPPAGRPDHGQEFQAQAGGGERRGIRQMRGAETASRSVS
jgi:hypothetical protein